MKVRHLLIVLGDQLNRGSAVFVAQSPSQDKVWMAEVAQESTKVWSHKVRTALFLSAMRHFRAELMGRGWSVDYQALDEHQHHDFRTALAHALDQHRPEKVRLVEPGEWAVREQLQMACDEADVELEILQDNHFIIDHDDFHQWNVKRNSWVMEHFYRFARQKTGYLMNGTEPVGGQWNFDKDNRHRFLKQGPGLLPDPLPFETDEMTQDVIALVASRFADHPGDLGTFNWPVTRAQALDSLGDFISHRLNSFGRYQDAMWTQQPWLYHSRLSAALNLKLLDPREVIEAAIDAYESGKAPINAVEGFVRQILGWREYVWHLYWAMMPQLLDDNALDAQQPLPAFFWDGDTDMICLADALGQTLKYGYAHHIQRLMVTGLFALLLGVKPKQLHQWYLAVYVDAVEWAEAPNTLGMSQYADGGKLASKPYVASGRYIQRMSNYCQQCPYDPAKRLGENACPFTTLYWDFLDRHQDAFSKHPRTALQWKNLSRLTDTERESIRLQANRLRERYRDSKPLRR